MIAGDAVAAFRLTTTSGNAEAAAFAAVDLAGPGFGRGWRVETKRDVSPAWGIEVRAPLARAVQAGDTALLHFYARAAKAADETGGGLLRVVVQQASPDYRKSLDALLNLGPEWQEFWVPFAFAGDYAAGAAEICFGFGFKRQTVEIGGMEVWHYGKRVELAALPKTRFGYIGRASDAAWRREALARIEQTRKSDVAITVRDAAGRPVAGATVRLEQRRSAFQFGSALQFARLVTDSADNKIYREKALELFNAASPEDDLKWGPWDGEWGTGYTKAQSLAALRWLQARGVPVRGHVLVWPGWKNLPESMRKLRDTGRQAEIPQRVIEHINEITTATRGLLTEWDVLNEPFDNHDLMALFGNDIMTTWFAAARANLPDAPLYLNDYANHDLVANQEHFQNFYRTVIFLQGAKAPLGGIGLQGHIGGQPNPPERILATLDLYAKFGLPVRFTEFDVDTDDEQLQADYTRDFLILAYSHPAVVGVQLWGFWQKAHWRPRAAMYRADWSEKPNALAYKSLVLDQWRTRVRGETDAGGRYVTRGFHGDYGVTVEAGGRRTERTFSLGATGGTGAVEVQLP